MNHATLVVVWLTASSLFIWFSLGQTLWSFLIRSSFLFVAILKMMGSDGRLYFGRKNGFARKFLWHTSLVLCYIMFVGFAISIQNYGDLTFSIVNLVLFSCLFTYLFLVFWPSHSLVGALQAVVVIAVITAIISIIETIDCSVLPPGQTH